MDNQHPAHSSLSDVAREVSDSLKSAIRSDFQIAKTELKESGKQVARHSVRLAVFGAIAMLGTLPFLSFLVVGLGSLLGQNYWLSSLIVSALMFIVGGIGVMFLYRKVKESDLTLDNTRESVSRHLNTVEHKLHEVADIAKARANRRRPV